MKRNIKKAASIAMAALMMTGMAFADSNYKTYETSINGVKYLPVRAVMESFGYEVIWNPQVKGIEMLKGAGYNAYYLESDSYVRNKMAPMKLQHKILLQNGRAYVSTADLEENMNLKDLSEDPYNEVVKISGLVIDRIDENGRIHCIQGEGEAFVLTEKAKITHYGKEGDYKITKADIGKELLITTPPYTAAIYPAQYQAFTVEVLPTDTSVYVGQVKEVRIAKEAGDTNDVLVSSDQREDVLIHVYKDTIIENLKGEKLKLEDVKVGSKITAYHSMAMTMSIPGQTNGFKLIVEQ